MPRVLLVEDDPGVRGALELGLALFGYEVVAVGTALEALEKISGVDLVVLDVLLPDRDGFQLLREIRARSPVPVLMLSALGEVEWRVKGLKEGADDYLAKPYSLQELAARLEALIRRTSRQAPSEPKALRVGELLLHPRRMEAYRKDRRLALSPKAFALLQAFMERPGEVLSREYLMRKVWGEEVEPNTLEVHLSLLRRELGEPPLLETVRGYGYRLRDDA